jgi:sarcosine oxidase delta subunit
MLHIKCPHCGMRSQNEFSYGGDATLKDQSLIKKYQTKIGITLSIIEKA